MTIINHKKNFIFVHPRRTGGSSLVLSLLKFCSEDDIICDDVLHDHLDKWIKFDLNKKFKPIMQKKINVDGIKHFVLSFIKILPFIKKFKKFNYSPNFSLKIPLFVEKPKFYSHTAVDEIKKVVNKEFFDKAFKFTIVRNPYDQFLSYYRASGSKENFLTFTKKEAFYFFNREISHFYQDSKIYNKIIKFENFEKDLGDLSNLLDLPENVFNIFKKIKANQFLQEGNKKMDISTIDDRSRELIYNYSKKIFDDFGYDKKIKNN